MKRNLLLYIFLFFTLSAFSQHSDLAGQYLFNPYLLNPAYGDNFLHNRFQGNNISLGTGVSNTPLKFAPKHLSVILASRLRRIECYMGPCPVPPTPFLAFKSQQTYNQGISQEHHQLSFGVGFLIRRINSNSSGYGKIASGNIRFAPSFSIGIGKASSQTISFNEKYSILYPLADAGVRLYQAGYGIREWSIGLSANNLVLRNIYFSESENETSNFFKPFYSIHGEYALKMWYNWQLKPKAFFFLNSRQDIGMIALESTHELSKNWKVSVGSSYATNNAWTFFGRMKFQALKMAFFDVFYAYQTNTSFNTPHQIGIGLGQFGKGFHYFN